MKTKFINTLLFFFLSICFLGAQEPKINYTLQSNESGATKSYVARDYISLKPGFQYSASTGNTFNAKIEPRLLFPPTTGIYAKQDGTLTDDYTQGGIVGAIAGDFAVSPTGAATYTIPIECPPGINGMTPKISLVYNSQGGNGVAGMGWHIGGISMISRVPKSIYYDNVVRGMDWTFESSLSLDGQRLIMDKNYEYYTENESFSKITALDWQVWGPEVFKVETKEGLTYIYGLKDNSAFYNRIDSNKRLGWMLYKVYDNFGNFIKYNYDYDNGINYYNWVVKSVSYGSEATGTENIIATITFHYNSRTDRIIGYIDGEYTQNDRLLKSISVVSNKIHYRDYNFDYKVNKIGKNELDNVYEAINDLSLNPTKILWGEINNEVKVDKIKNTYTSFHTGTENKNWFSADVDGDGVSEIIAMFRDDEPVNGVYRPRTRFEVFKPTVNATGVLEFERPANYFSSAINMDYGIMVKKMDGAFAMKYNDLEDPWLIVPSLQKHASYTSMSFINIKNEKEYEGIQFALKAHVSDIPIYSFADLNNDGYDDIVVIEQAKVNGEYTVHIIYGNPSKTIVNAKSFGININGKPERLFISDFNNNGLKDLFVVTDKGYNFFQNVGGSSLIGGSINGVIDVTFKLVASGDMIRYLDPSAIKMGDFNGDGLMDFVFNVPTTSEWYFALNRGNWQFNQYRLTAITAIEESYTERNDNKDNCIVFDFDNDGKDDVIIIETDYKKKSDISGSWGEFQSSYIAWYKSTGTSVALHKKLDNNREDYSFRNHVVIGDFNGDGRTDLLNFSSNLYNNVEKDKNYFYLHHSFNTNYEGNKVKSITDALGNSVEFKYSPLTDCSYYETPVYSTSNFNRQKNPVFRLKAPIYVLYESAVKNGTRVYPRTTYHYQDALVHTQGKGLLGFMFTKSTEETNNIVTETTSKFNNTFYSLLPETAKQYCNGNVVNVTTQNISLLSLGNKRFEFRINSVVNEDKLVNTKHTQTFSNHDAYGNARTIEVDYGEGISDTKTLTYVQKGAWCPNRIATLSTTKRNNNGSETTRTNYSYHDNGKLYVETLHPSLPDMELKTTYLYDAFGNNTSISVNSGHISYTKGMSYTPSGRFLTKEINRDTEESVTYVYDEGMALLTKKIERIGTTEYIYDKSGRLIETIYPDGIKESTVLRWAGPNATKGAKYYLYSQVSGKSPVYKWYNGSGQEILRESYGLKNNKIHVFMEYEMDGKIKRISAPTFSNVTNVWNETYTYDSYGRISSLTNRIGTTTYKYNTRTNTVQSPDQISITTINAVGQVITSTVNGKSIAYTYHPSGLVKTATPDKMPGVSMEYDKQGNRIKIDDPNAGITCSHYNAFGQIEWSRQKIHKDADSITTRYVYQQDGKLKSVNRNGKITHYNYNSTNKQLASVKIEGESEQEFTYDKFDRINKIREHVGSKYFDTQVEYDLLGRISKEVYPSGYFIINKYDANGNLTEIVDNNGTSVWKILQESARRELIREQKGSKETSFGYNNKGQLTYIFADGVTFQSYDYNSYGLMSSRSDNLAGQRETFDYDNQRRLEKWDLYQYNRLVKENKQVYDDKGNISDKYDNLTGNFHMKYGVAGKPHALESIEGAYNNFPEHNQHITYTDFKKVSTITEGNKKYTLSYSVDKERIKSVYNEDGVDKLTKYYLSNYEEEIDSKGNIRKIHYITGGGIMIEKNGVKNLYYSYTDHLGSLTALTDASGKVIERYSYDVWGIRRNPDNWLVQDTRKSFKLDRGYNMHEHLDIFDLINMNGRVYDPFTSQFLSPDPYIQAPDNWLNYNRYTYVLNNPLKYIDPTGEWWGWDDLAAAGVGFITGYVSYGLATGNWGWKALAAGGSGAVVSWIGWNIMGPGHLAFDKPGKAATLGEGLSTVLSSTTNYYGQQFAIFTFMNAQANKTELTEKDKNGWGGVASFSVYTTSAMLSTTLKPEQLDQIKHAKRLNWIRFTGVTLTNNISTNIQDGKLGLHNLHLGIIGYNFDNNKVYTAFDKKGLGADNRFNMIYETVLGAALVDRDIFVKYRKNIFTCRGSHISYQRHFIIPTEIIGEYANKAITAADIVFMILYGQTTYEYWYSNNYDENGRPK